MEKSMFETQRLRLRSCLLHVYGFFALVLRPIHVIGLWSLWPNNSLELANQSVLYISHYTSHRIKDSNPKFNGAF